MESLIEKFQKSWTVWKFLILWGKGLWRESIKVGSEIRDRSVKIVIPRSWGKRSRYTAPTQDRKRMIVSATIFNHDLQSYPKKGNVSPCPGSDCYFCFRFYDWILYMKWILNPELVCQRAPESNKIKIQSSRKTEKTERVKRTRDATKTIIETTSTSS